MEKDKKIKLAFLISIIAVFFSGAMAAAYQTDFGRIDVQEIAIVDEFNGDKVVGKLYRPKGVTIATPAPAVLGLHGYNNDKDVQRPAALELAKAGLVVLALDQTGHGDSEGIANFFLQGADTAYNWLQNLSFVNGDKMGIYGHSMGYIVGSQVAAANPDHDACAFQTFPPFLHNFSITHNVLHIWSEYEEFYDLPWFFITGALATSPVYTLDMSVSEIITIGIATLETNAGIGPGTGAIDTTYGSFAAGDAYREHLIRGLTHPGQTMDPGSTAEIVAWMLQALSGLNENDAWAIAAVTGQTFVVLEMFGGIALLFSFISVIFLSQILLATRFFGKVKQPMPERVVTEKKSQWWIFATINTVIAAVFFGLFTHADVHWAIAPNVNWSEPWIMGMINNWLGFFVTTAAASLFLTSIWYFLGKRKDRGSITLYDLGATYEEGSLMTNIKNKTHWLTFGKTALLAVTLFGWMYLLVSIFQTYFLIEFRIFWAFAKMFTPERFLMFLLYLPVFIPFFLLNGGVFLFGQIRQKEESSTVKTHLMWWGKILYATLFGLFLLLLIQYVGVLFSNYPYSGWWFNPIMPIQLMSAIPFYALLYYIMIIFYRKTGKIYLGSIFGAVMTVWFLTVGTVAAAGI
ncbi:MAG: alpha/beta hydrolase [Promethearchaeota archaeon]|jgi:pimeloyl-ACP methyl ester carboxylesterase